MDLETEQVHIQTHIWELDPEESFAGIALVTGTEVKKTLPTAKEV